MTIRPDLGNDLAVEIAEAYREAELRILRIVASKLAVGIDTDPLWETKQLANIQAVRALALKELAAVNRGEAARILGVLEEAYGIGQASALSDLSSFVDATSAESAAASRKAVEVVSAQLTNKLASVSNAVLRAVPDIYQQVVGRAVQQTLITGGRQALAQAALNELLGRGILTSPVSGGSRMSLTDYVTMAVRTGTMQSAIFGHTSAMSDAGLDFCIIQPGPRVCDECDPWCGIILSVSGQPAGTYTVTDLTTGEPIDIECEGSLDDARADGWGHPNCRCGLKAYIPGATKLQEREPWDQAGYEAQQTQRYNERMIRDWKTQESLALSEQSQASAAAKVAEWQGKQRDLLASNDFLKRQYDREQIGVTL